MMTRGGMLSLECGDVASRGGVSLDCSFRCAKRRRCSERRIRGWCTQKCEKQDVGYLSATFQRVAIRRVARWATWKSYRCIANMLTSLFLIIAGIIPLHCNQMDMTVTLRKQHILRKRTNLARKQTSHVCSFVLKRHEMTYFHGQSLDTKRFGLRIVPHNNLAVSFWLGNHTKVTLTYRC